ncbi:MAG: calcium-translocating P-type ATPase, PMCA-type [Oscillospiraceae bacterium]|nr:calcium-translocating P-type ATPase, PMCA-type [Oscillospiraceae bacterium]
MRLKGLTEAEVLASRGRHGENRVAERKGRGLPLRVLENLGDPMIKILLVALGINLIFVFRTSEWAETVGIAAAVFLAVLISTVSEQGAQSAFRKLREDALKIKCRVARDGGTVELPVEDVVVGDLVFLQSGDRVPADGVLVSGKLELDQSAINGESKEARKAVGDVCPAAAVAVAGEGVLRVTAVGDRTVYGQIAGEVQEEKSVSPLKARLSELAGTISLFGYVGAALAALAYLFNVVLLDHQFDAERILPLLRDPAFTAEKLLRAATLAVTVIVVAVPEGLPMMITVVLSANMKRMLKDHVLVRKLVGIETAGSMNILFTDKTGTLTKGKLQVTGVLGPSGGAAEVDKALHRALVWNNSAALSKGRAVGGNATDRALLEFAAKHRFTHRLKKGRVTPFDSKVKTMSTEVKGEFNGTLLKGAPEVVLPQCANADRRLLAASMARLQEEGARLIAVAEDNRLLGVLAIRDDVRAEAESGVRLIQNAGIQVVMITGDAKATAVAIARRVGLLASGGSNEGVITSGDLSRMSDDEVRRVLPELRVVARALPGDKSRLVRLAQGMGLVAGMTGDGVNDAPALRRADVGFAMGSGTEVAKEAGDIVILDDNLLSIAKAVRYGRTIFKSIRKFIIFQLNINLCALGVSVIAPLIGADTPITVMQMLWINMVMDTLAGLAFGGEPALAEHMREPPKRRGEPIVNRYMAREIALSGVYGVGLCLWFLKSPVTAALFPSPARFMTAFFALFMFMGIFQSLSARTHKLNLMDHLAANKPFIGIMGLVAAVQTALVYVGGDLFRADGLSFWQLAFVLLLASTAMIARTFRVIWYQYRKMICGT